LNLAIVIAAIPINFGRQKFDDGLLKLQIPQIRDLDKSLVLMTGYEPTAYIVPSFPAGPRFVRISSTFTTPGRNPYVDREIKKILAAYDRQRIFAFIQRKKKSG